MTACFFSCNCGFLFGLCAHVCVCVGGFLKKKKKVRHIISPCLIITEHRMCWRNSLCWREQPVNLRPSRRFRNSRVSSARVDVIQSSLQVSGKVGQKGVINLGVPMLAVAVNLKQTNFITDDLCGQTATTFSTSLSDVQSLN